MRYFTKKNYTKPSPSGTIALNDYYIILINKKTGEIRYSSKKFLFNTCLHFIYKHTRGLIMPFEENIKKIYRKYTRKK